ncbi:MAG: DinB family protein [Pyrinomonadaceae bacterium]
MSEEIVRADGEIARAFVAEARRLLAEDYLPKIERCLEHLEEVDIWWRPNEASNSVGNLLRHLAGNARQWIVAGVGGAEDRRARQSEFDAGTRRQPGDAEQPTAQELLARLRATLAEVDAVLARLGPATLLERRTIQGLSDVVVLDAVFHVVEHFSMHTGQIIQLTKMRAASDLGFYDFASGKPRASWK